MFCSRDVNSAAGALMTAHHDAYDSSSYSWLLYSSLACKPKSEVNNVIEFMNRVSKTAKFTNKCIEQNAFYCGYDCNMMVNNVFAYGPDGKVFLWQ